MCFLTVFFRKQFAGVGVVDVTGIVAATIVTVVTMGSR